MAWAKAVQGNTVADRLAHAPPEASSELLKNQYTIIQLDKQGNYYDVPYARYFEKELGPILAAFDAAVRDLGTLKELQPQQQRYIEYLELYRRCLAEEDPLKLEPMWEDLVSSSFFLCLFFLSFFLSFFLGFFHQWNRVRNEPD